MSHNSDRNPERVPFRGSHYVEAAAFDRVLASYERVCAENDKLESVKRDLRRRMLLDRVERDGTAKPERPSLVRRLLGR